MTWRRNTGLFTSPLIIVLAHSRQKRVVTERQEEWICTVFENETLRFCNHFSSIPSHYAYKSFSSSCFKGCRDGAVVRAMWLGFDSQIRRQMWVEFVGSLLWGLFRESPETFRAYFGWHNSFCIFKTKAFRGTKLCSHFCFSSLYNIRKDQLYRISRSYFYKWLFGPEKFSGLSRNGYSGFPSPQKPKFDLIVLIVNFSYSVPN